MRKNKKPENKPKTAEKPYFGFSTADFRLNNGDNRDLI
jgi:hypothetical protein